MKTRKYTYLSLVLSFFMAAPITALGMSSARSRSNSVKMRASELGKKPNEQVWSGSVRTGMSKNQDEYSDYFSSTNFEISRALGNGKTLSVSTSYSQPVSDDQDKVKRYGIGDLDLSLGWDELYRFNESGSLAGSIGFTGPSSRTSRLASMNGAFNGSLSTSWKLPQNFRFSTNHGLTLFSYQYDTANDDGDVYNSPFGTSNGISLGWGANSFRITGSYSLYYTQNYAKTDIWVQSVGSSVSYSFTNSISAALGFSWRDRILTNNSLFDDDTTVTSLSVSYAF